MNIQALEADGIRFACSAVEYDQKGYIDEAIFFYRVSGCNYYYFRLKIQSNILLRTKICVRLKRNN